MRWLAAACLWLAGLAVIYLSNLAFFVAGGSDSLTDIAAPPVFGQMAAMLLAALGLALSVWKAMPGGVWVRLISTALSAVLIVFASHRVVVDSARGLIRDVWLLRDLQVMPFDQRDGPAASAILERGPAWDHLVAKTGGAKLLLIRGVPPLAVNMAPLEVWWERG
jgi:hypothetical protein